MLEAFAVIVLTLAIERAITIPRDIRRNDELLRNRDEDLTTWIEDSDKDLASELRRVETAARETSRTYLVGYRYQELKDALLHRYRDQRRDADRTFRSVAISEEAWHSWYRRVRKRSMPALTAPEVQAETLARWDARAESPEQAIKRLGAEFGELGERKAPPN